MFHKDLDDLTHHDLEALISHQTREGRTIEFKRDLYAGSDKAKREAAADISAMANASGGTLILGIEEKNGVANKLVGVASENPDQLLLSIQESLRSGIEPVLQGVRVKWVPMSEQRGVVVISVPRSWVGPHRVTLAKDLNFYIRNENGKHPMSVEEIRRAFAAGPDLRASVERFREDRLTMIENDEGPLAVDEGFPKLVVHIVPYIAFREPITIDLTNVLMAPIGSRGWSDFASVDGKVSYSGSEEEFSSVRAYTTFFRNGSVEAVAKIYSGEKDGKKQFHLAGVEDAVLGTFKDAQRKYSELGIPAPFAVLVSILDVKDHHGTGARSSWSVTIPCRRNRLLLPAVEVEEADLAREQPNAMYPLATLLWNSFGHKFSPNFDEDGRYQPNRGSHR